MANEIVVKFGSFQFTGNYSVSDFSFPETMPVKVNDIPKNDGSVAAEAKRKSMNIKIKGTVQGADYDATRTNMDALKAAIYSGKQNFTLDDDRQIKCQLKSFNPKPIFLRRYIEFTITFTADYPYFVNQTLSEDDASRDDNDTFALVNNGNAPARVKVTATAPGGGISDNFSITNQTNSLKSTYRGDITAADDLIIDNRVGSDDFIITNDGVDDFANFEGDFLVLNPGSNTILYEGDDATNLKFEWRDTYV